MATSYVAGDLAKWLEDKGIEHVRGAPYHPQTQGKIERWHQTLKNRRRLSVRRAFGQIACQIASKCDPLFAAKNDPFDGAETGGAEPHIAEQSRSWRAASGGGRAVMRGS